MGGREFWGRTSDNVWVYGLWEEGAGLHEEAPGHEEEKKKTVQHPAALAAAPPKQARAGEILSHSSRLPLVPTPGWYVPFCYGGTARLQPSIQASLESTRKVNI